MKPEIDYLKLWLGSGSLNIFGSPFSGKDTQGKVLADLFDGVLIGGGDILRHTHGPNSINEIMSAGGIVPSDFYLKTIEPYLARPEFNDRPLILSAVGRAHGEEQAVIDAALNAGHELKAAIFLIVGSDEVWRRFEASQKMQDRVGRSDDSKDIIITRLKKFTERTLPVIEFYRERKLLVEVNGELTASAVTDEILHGLANFAKLSAV